MDNDLDVNSDAMADATATEPVGRPADDSGEFPPEDAMEEDPDAETKRRWRAMKPLARQATPDGIAAIAMSQQPISGPARARWLKLVDQAMGVARMRVEDTKEARSNWLQIRNQLLRKLAADPKNTMIWARFRKQIQSEMRHYEAVLQRRANPDAKRGKR